MITVSQACLELNPGSDTGFRNFFGAGLPADKWDARAFRPFLVGPEGGALTLRCELFNVR